MAINEVIDEFVFWIKEGNFDKARRLIDFLEERYGKDEVHRYFGIH